MTTSPAEPHRRIKSFVKRGGRLSDAQARARAAFGAEYMLPFSDAPLDFAQAFGNTRPTVLEIGFGMGETTAAIATALPELNFLGVEVHEAGVAALCKRIGEATLGNVRIIEHDAVEVLQHMIPQASLQGVHIYFPDPWHKKRHHKRRLIQPPFVKNLASHLKSGGYLHCATDWLEYADQMLEVLSAEPALKNTAAGFAEKPAYRPTTKFEARGLRLGHGVRDLVFSKL
jgi:tRNA (guanine-N7-)-methyltransferase